MQEKDKGVKQGCTPEKQQRTKQERMKRMQQGNSQGCTQGKQHVTRQESMQEKY